MSYSAKKTAPSPEIKEEAKKLARAQQRPGQTREQTRLIAQGIQKGIAQYKKEHKARLRAQDKKQKKHTSQPETTDTPAPAPQEVIRYRQHWLPWTLLLVSWLTMGGYLLFLAK